MALTVRDAQQAVDTGSTTGSDGIQSPAVTIVDGDLVIIAVMQEGEDGSTPSIIDGDDDTTDITGEFTTLTLVGPANTTAEGAIFYKTASGEPGSYNVEWATGAGFQSMTIQVWIIYASEGGTFTVPVGRTDTANDNTFNDTDTNASITVGSEGTEHFVFTVWHHSTASRTISGAGIPEVDGVDMDVTDAVQSSAQEGMSVAYFHQFGTTAGAEQPAVTWDGNAYGTMGIISGYYTASGGGSFDIYQLAVG